MYSNLTYSDITEEFAVRVPDWARLDGYVTDAIIRDAYRKLGEFWWFWSNHVENCHECVIPAFVRNYIETVESLPFCKEREDDVANHEIWTIWGLTLRLLEVG